MLRKCRMQKCTMYGPCLQENSQPLGPVLEQDKKDLREEGKRWGCGRLFAKMTPMSC